MQNFLVQRVSFILFSILVFTTLTFQKAFSQYNHGQQRSTYGYGRTHSQHNLNGNDRSTYSYYYGKNLNAMIKGAVVNFRQTQQSSGQARPTIVANYNSEALVEEIFKVLAYNHIEKADQGFDAIVQNCVPNGGATCYKHGLNDYTYSRLTIYNELDKRVTPHGAPYVMDVYCNQNFPLEGGQRSRMKKGGDQGFGGPQPRGDINIEHTWPKSRFTTQFSFDLQKGDLHHLFPSNGTINGIRSSYPFGEVVTIQDRIKNCPSVLGLDAQGREVFEPEESHKGNIARALFYFSMRYKTDLKPWEEEVLRTWHIQDPVDEAERTRNERIFQIQKNRNPFVDFPEIVSLIKDF